MMNRLGLIMIFLILPFFWGFAQPDKKICVPQRYSNYPMGELIKEISRVNSICFYYLPSSVESEKISIESDSIRLTEFLKIIAETGKLDYYVSGTGNIYLFSKRAFVTKLPLYFLKDNPIVEKSAIDHSLGFLVGRDANTQTIIEVGVPGQINESKKVKVLGHLMDESTNAPLIGATLFIKDNGAGVSTNANGDLVIHLKQGTYSVVFQCVGMQEKNCQLKVYSSGSFTLKMSQSVLSIDEVQVRKVTGKRGTGSGIESVDYMSIKEMPTLLGEKDVLKIAQLLPGIVSVSEGSGGVNVRGGNADQNLFYIQKIPVYNSSHLFGFFSSVNSSAVENFSIYKGQIPVSYGGRLSSVFDVQIRNAPKDKFFTEGGISPVSANIELETPLIKNKMGLIVSGRSTYSNWILKQLKDPDLRNSKASFYDIISRIDYDLTPKDKLSLSGYISSDYFNLNGLTNYTYGNSGGVLEYNHRFNPRLKLSGYLVGSNYHFKTIDESTLSDAYEHSYRIGQYELRTEMDWSLNKYNSVQLGFSNILYHLDRGNVNPYGDESLRSIVSLGKERAMEGAVFFSDEVKIGSRLTAYLGLRYSYFSALGPKTVRMYKPGVEKSDLSVEGTKEYGNNESIAFYSNPEFRAGLDFRVSLNGSLKMSFTQMDQYLFMLSNTTSIAPNDQWKLADNHIKPQRSMQYSLGYYHRVNVPKLLLSAEIYYKKGNDIVEYKDGADFLSTPYVETTILQGVQDAYGAELMISKEAGKFNGWLSYTYSRSNITVDGLNTWEKINDGKSYPSNFDKPHVLNMVLNWKINRRYSISSNVVYNSGRPVTLPIGYYYLESFPYVDYSERNEYRIPYYFRADLSVKVEGNLKKKKKVHSYWMASVYNLTGRKNVNSVFFKSEDGLIKGYQYSVVGVPVFTISWNWKLGNYANH
ncbi:MAG TPA: TonB-dependent receptor [Prolixibacteraceae bacterium]|nr:TonB-dependent receptor [Prolixibacteraceae bacterium]